jgi:glycosyltransferase involved in cell wall biosynthesis
LSREVAALLSVVIAALNNEDTLGQTLSSLFSNTLSADEFEVIVVDNGSKDKTVEVANKFPVKVFSCPKRGQGPARNVGLSKASGDIICLTDADVIVPEDWLESIMEFFSRCPQVDGVGGPVLPPLKGHVNKLQKLEGELYARTHVFPTKMVESKFGDNIGMLYSANCAFRREAFVSSGGFDESGFDAVDIDFCWRLILNGKRLVFDPELKVVHLGFPWSLKGVFNQQFRWGESRGILNMRYPHSRFTYTGLATKVRMYYFPFVLFAQILYSKGKKKSVLQLFEKSAFTLGCMNTFLKAWFKHETLPLQPGGGW